MMVLSVIFVIFVCSLVLQFVFYVLLYTKFSFAKKQENIPQKMPISILVCAKNEIENIKKYFPLLLAQNYPDFEIVLIDDASTDGTDVLFEQYEKQHKQVKVVKVLNNEAFWGNKKYALTLGIKAAKNEHLVFIEPNCYPNSKNWLAQLSSAFSSTKTIVLGYSSTEKTKNSLYNKLIRFDAMLAATQYFSFAKMGKAYMGTEKNMAYNKSEFFRINGFINHIKKIRTGAAILFVNEAATKENVTTLYTADSFTYTEAKNNYKEWLTKKRRMWQTLRFAKNTFHLKLFYASQFLFFSSFISLLVFLFQWQLILILVGFRYLFVWIVLYPSAKKLNETDTIYWLPFIEIAHTFAMLKSLFLNTFRKPKSWK